ncbi:hypothetical protein DID75_01210 [Candidatus Marinamargulisbacteria bacterium SCGC AG-410-N11]|nr:hypothetical protein DID75_01210 [Candidatus Marinamargulisbacteria bacterium SCGC AG-410-N11]
MNSFKYYILLISIFLLPYFITIHAKTDSFFSPLECGYQIAQDLALDTPALISTVSINYANSAYFTKAIQLARSLEDDYPLIFSQTISQIMISQSDNNDVSKALQLLSTMLNQNTQNYAAEQLSLHLLFLNKYDEANIAISYINNITIQERTREQLIKKLLKYDDYQYASLIVQSMNDSIYKNNAYFLLIEYLIQNYNFSMASTLIELVQNQLNTDFFRSKIAITYLSRDSVNKAIEFQDQISDPKYYDQVQAEFVKYYCESNQYRNAYEIINNINTPESFSYAAVYLGDSFLQNDLIDDFILLLDSIDTSSAHYKLTLKLASYYISNQDFEKAVNCDQFLENKSQLSTFYNHISKLLGKRNNHHQALFTIRNNITSDYQNSCLKEFIISYAFQGDFTTTRRLIQNILDIELRHSIISELVTLFLKSKNWHNAINICDVSYDLPFRIKQYQYIIDTSPYNYNLFKSIKTNLNDMDTSILTPEQFVDYSICSFDTYKNNDIKFAKIIINDAFENALLIFNSKRLKKTRINYTSRLIQSGHKKNIMKYLLKLPSDELIYTLINSGERLSSFTLKEQMTFLDLFYNEYSKK